jgi:hypothetical protein
MDKGLRAERFCLCNYVKVAKDLRKMGKGDLAVELKSIFQSFDVYADVGR